MQTEEQFDSILKEIRDKLSKIEETVKSNPFERKEDLDEYITRQTIKLQIAFSKIY